MRTETPFKCFQMKLSNNRNIIERNKYEYKSVSNY